jgi:hypothetical protein
MRWSKSKLEMTESLTIATVLTALGFEAFTSLGFSAGGFSGAALSPSGFSAAATQGAARRAVAHSPAQKSCENDVKTSLTPRPFVENGAENSAFRVWFNNPANRAILWAAGVDRLN